HVRSSMKNVEFPTGIQLPNKPGSVSNIKKCRRQRRLLVISQQMPLDAVRRERFPYGSLIHLSRLKRQQHQLVPTLNKLAQIGDHLGLNQRLIDAEITDVKGSGYRSLLIG